jgi:hypothetical protein
MAAEVTIRKVHRVTDQICSTVSVDEFAAAVHSTPIELQLRAAAPQYNSFSIPKKRWIQTLDGRGCCSTKKDTQGTQ